jgi:hypothetical protein
VEFRTKCKKELLESEVRDEEILQLAEDKVNKEQQEMLFKLILKNEDLKTISSSLGERIVTHMKATSIIVHYRESLSLMRQIFIKEVTKELEAKYNIKSKIPRWLGNQIASKLETFDEEHRWWIYDKSLEDMRKEGIIQEEYLLSKVLEFRKGQESKMVKEWRESKKPGIL